MDDFDKTVIAYLNASHEAEVAKLGPTIEAMMESKASEMSAHNDLMLFLIKRVGAKELDRELVWI